MSESVTLISELKDALLEMVDRHVPDFGHPFEVLVEEAEEYLKAPPPTLTPPQALAVLTRIEGSQTVVRMQNYGDLLKAVADSCRSYLDPKED